MSTINNVLLKHKIAQLPSQEELTPEQRKQDQIDLINDWAIANPTRVLGDDFYQQRRYLTPETWRKVVSELNLTKDEILKNKKIPDHIKSTAFNNSIRETTNEAAKPLAAVMIGGASIPVLAGFGSAAGVLGNTLKFGLTNPVGQQLTKKFIGDMLVGTAGSMAVNEGSKALTGKTIGDHFETVTDYIPYLNRIPGQYRNMAGEFLNIGGWMGGALFSNTANRLAGLTNRGLSYAGKQVDNLLSGNNYYKNYQLARELNKNIRNITLQPTAADEAALRGQLGWAPKQIIPYRHGSLDPELKTFVPKYDRWDVTTHGADPNMYFVTDQSTPISAANMMDLRPYQYTGSIVAEKPMVQIGDFNIAGKNGTRNQLIARARQQGADTYLLQDIVDNKAQHLNVVARFIGPEGEAVQGEAASIKWYGPTMGKTTAAKVTPNLVDIDPLLKPIRAKHAKRLGLEISDPKVSADPAYKQEVADFVLEWRANPENQGKTLVASTKHLLDPQYKVKFANEPSIPDFETFAARNKARGFKETDEQLRAWYNSILELGRDLHIDNRFVSDIESGTRSAKISEAERLGISKLLRHSILKPSLAKYEAKLIGDKEIGVFDQNGNKIGHTLLRPIGDNLEVAYIERNKLYTLPEGEKFQEIGFEAARQYASKLGKKLSTSDSFEHPLYLIPVIARGFLTRPIKNKNRIHWNADPTDANMDMAARIQVVRDRLQLQRPFLTVNDLTEASELSDFIKLSPVNSRGNSVPIYSLPELYDYKGTFVKPEWWKYIEEDGQSNFVYDELLNGYNVPGFYESWIGKPKRNFGVKFHFKSGGTIHIKEKNKGKFTESAKRAGKSVQEHAKDVVNDPKATKLQKKRAQFALNAKKFKHLNGGTINYLNLFQ